MEDFIINISSDGSTVEIDGEGGLERTRCNEIFSNLKKKLGKEIGSKPKDTESVSHGVKVSR